jgi:hypothetical protein
MMGSLFLAVALGFFQAAEEESATSNVNATVEAELAKLPGKTGFAFTELTPQGPKLLYGVRENERFAVGSSFKLFILGTLIKDVNEDRRQLDDVMLLKADLVGPPHSEMAEWPMGSPVTLYTLALKMISISDNTATDHLLFELGRESIERQAKVMIGEDAVWNTPLLSTREMTMLRDRKTGMLGNAYQNLDEAQQRKFLARLDAGKPNYEAMDFDTAAYKVAEWYATPLDMATALSWIHQHTKKDKPASLVRQILTIDPKLPHDAKEWPFVGFKGGSEDQLLAGNWLLKNQNGKWYTMHVYYNNPDGKADQEKLIAAIGAIFGAVNAAMK